MSSFSHANHVHDVSNHLDRPSIPMFSHPAQAALFRAIFSDISDMALDLAAGRCSHCGRPQGRATGTLCQRCSDDALIEIARFGGVHAIASDAWSADGDPTAEHPIWAVLARSLDRGKRGTSINALYPVLEQLRLCETLTVLETDEGQFAFEQVTLPHPAQVAERCWLIVWSERYAHFIVSAFAGEQRDTRLLATIANITQGRDRAALYAQTEANLAANKVYYRL